MRYLPAIVAISSGVILLGDVTHRPQLLTPVQAAQDSSDCGQVTQENGYTVCIYDEDGRPRAEPSSLVISKGQSVQWKCMSNSTGYGRGYIISFGSDSSIQVNRSLGSVSNWKQFNRRNTYSYQIEDYPAGTIDVR